jgi:hypothetical protein
VKLQDVKRQKKKVRMMVAMIVFVALGLCLNDSLTLKMTKSFGIENHCVRKGRRDYTGTTLPGQMLVQPNSWISQPSHRKG